LNPGLAFAEIHGRVPTATTGLSAAEEKEKTSKQKNWKDQARSSLLPGSRLPGRLNSDVHVVIREHLEQILVWSQIHFRSTAISCHNLCCSAIGREQNSTDLILLNLLNEIAVTEVLSRRRGIWTVKESRSDHDHHDY